MLLPILKFPDSRLRKKALAVESITPAIKKLANDMFETMYAAGGIGLAATQVNIQKRVVVIDLKNNSHYKVIDFSTHENNKPLVFINPELTVLDSSLEKFEEGCLSVPDINALVSRAKSVRITALDLMGKKFVMETTGMLAICIQHEVDHLDGKLFIDYLSALKRERIRNKLQAINS